MPTATVIILVYIAERSGKLLAPSGLERWRALEATAFMTSEIHKGFTPYFRSGTEAEKALAARALYARFETLAYQLGDQRYLIGEHLTIADCYLFVMLSWAALLDVPVPDSLSDYQERMKAEHAIAHALSAEGVA